MNPARSHPVGPVATIPSAIVLDAILAALVVAAAIMLAAAFPAPALGGTVVVETVVIGNPGNPGEQSRLGSGDPTFYGGVGYTYSIGTHEVTARQYTAFLNAVAATDTHNLYNTRMDHGADPSRNGCNIRREGVPGSYTYFVPEDWADRPVNFVSWADAARFANWMHNGQPTGGQVHSTTEDGSYFLDGVSEGDDRGLESVVREPDATWVIPSEDEWYKAAYHRNDGATGNYWNYPTRADGGVSNQLVDPDPGNNATFSVGQESTIGPPYYRTTAGAHENSTSAYGTFDQGGNVMEFTEAVPEPDIRRIRGGSWLWGRTLLSASEVDDVMHSSDQLHDLGFRVALVATEPASAPGLGTRTEPHFRIDGPHPFRDEARFVVELPEAARVRIEFFDLAGRRQSGGIDDTFPAGRNEVRWSADDLAHGVYVATLSASGRTATVRCVLVP